MLHRLFGPIVILALLLGSPLALTSVRAQAAPLDYLPNTLFLPHAGCFQIDGEGTLDFAGLLARFAQVPDAATTLSTLGWQAGAYRQFGCDNPPAGRAGYIDIGVHLFATAEGAQQAAPFFAESRILGTDLRLVPGQTAVTGPAGNGTEFTQYLTYDNLLVRVTGVAPTGNPDADVAQVGMSMLAGAAIVTSQNASAASNPPVQQAPAAAVDYDIIDLGTMSGNVSWATLINNQNVVIWGWGTATDPDTVFPLVSGGGLLASWSDGDADLSAVGFAYTVAINNDGLLIGQNRDPLIYNVATGQLRDPDPALAGVYVSDINDAGTIVGTSGGQGLLVASTGITSLLPPPGYEGLATNGVNNSRQVAATVYNGSRVGDQRAAVVDGETGETLVVLDPVANGSGSNGVDINDAGLMIVGSDVGGARGMPLGGQGYVYDTTTGAVIPLGSLGGRPNTNPTAINEAGQVVGFVWGGEAGMVSGPFNIPFLFDTNTGTMTDLNTLIDPDSGWVLYRASDINDAGLIVGQGMVQGTMHAFILVPR